MMPAAKLGATDSAGTTQGPAAGRQTDTACLRLTVLQVERAALTACMVQDLPLQVQQQLRSVANAWVDAWGIPPLTRREAANRRAEFLMAELADLAPMRAVMSLACEAVRQVAADKTHADAFRALYTRA